MSSFNVGPQGTRPTADNDIYTALLAISALALLAATGYVAYRMVSLFGSLLPPGGG